MFSSLFMFNSCFHSVVIQRVCVCVCFVCVCVRVFCVPTQTIMGAMLLAAAEVQMQSGTTSSSSSSSLDDAGSRAGGRQPPGTLTYDQARGLVSWVVDTAGVLVREGYERLRYTHTHTHTHRHKNWQTHARVAASAWSCVV